MYRPHLPVTIISRRSQALLEDRCRHHRRISCIFFKKCFSNVKENYKRRRIAETQSYANNRRSSGAERLRRNSSYANNRRSSGAKRLRRNSSYANNRRSSGAERLRAKRNIGLTLMIRMANQAMSVVKIMELRDWATHII
jgi:hypothetical protein